MDETTTKMKTHSWSSTERCFAFLGLVLASTVLLSFLLFPRERTTEVNTPLGCELGALWTLGGSLGVRFSRSRRGSGDDSPISSGAEAENRGEKKGDVLL